MLMTLEARDTISTAIDDLCYVTGYKVYDDAQVDVVRQNMARKNFVKRGCAHLASFARDGISEPIESFLNYDL